MASIPVDKDEIDSFTPPSLANLAAPPVFLLRPATERDLRSYRRALMIAGLQQHDVADIRDEILRGLEAKWSPEDYETAKGILRGYWDFADTQAALPPDERTPLPQDDLAAANHLTGQVASVWEPLRTKIADNVDFEEDAPKVALGMFLRGWRNLSVPYSRQADTVSLETIDAMARELLRVEAEAVANKVEGVVAGVAFYELVTHVLNSMNLNRSEEKNSPSQSPLGSIPNGSTAISPTDGASKASATSRKTPSAKSPKTI